MMAPTYLKWMLLFEDPTNQTLWLAKATPREWLSPGQAAIVVTNGTTRYGRVSYQLRALPSAATPAATPAAAPAATSYSVRASVHLPATFGAAATAPRGGVRLRLRAPTTRAGTLSRVLVGGKPWAAVDAAAETIDFDYEALQRPALLEALRDIVATWD